MAKIKTDCVQNLHWGCALSPVGWMRLGWIRLAWTAAEPQALCRLEFCDSELCNSEFLNGQKNPKQCDARNNAHAQAWVQQMFGLEGSNPKLQTITLHIKGTPFQHAVWRALAATPWGSTLSYQDLAVRSGHPKAARAVGQAMACNPLAVLVPCHRVLKNDGSLGHYHWGVERKAALLGWEQSHPQPAFGLHFVP